MGNLCSQPDNGMTRPVVSMPPGNVQRKKGPMANYNQEYSYSEDPSESKGSTVYGEIIAPESKDLPFIDTDRRSDNSMQSMHNLLQQTFSGILKLEVPQATINKDGLS